MIAFLEFFDEMRKQKRVEAIFLREKGKFKFKELTSKQKFILN